MVVRGGSSAAQDGRFSNKDKKEMAKLKCPPEYKLSVDFTKLVWPPLEAWIMKRVTELLKGVEDEVLVGTILESLKQSCKPKELHYELVPFLANNTGLFMKELWALLHSASQSKTGIPVQFEQEERERIQRRNEYQAKLQAKFQQARERQSAPDDGKLDSPGPPGPPVRPAEPRDDGQSHRDRDRSGDDRRPRDEPRYHRHDDRGSGHPRDHDRRRDHRGDGAGRLRDERGGHRERDARERRPDDGPRDERRREDRRLGERPGAGRPREDERDRWGSDGHRGDVARDDRPRSERRDRDDRAISDRRRVRVADDGRARDNGGGRREDRRRAGREPADGRGDRSERAGEEDAGRGAPPRRPVAGVGMGMGLGAPDDENDTVVLRGEEAGGEGTHGRKRHRGLDDDDAAGDRHGDRQAEGSPGAVQCGDDSGNGRLPDANGKDVVPERLRDAVADEDTGKRSSRHKHKSSKEKKHKHKRRREHARRESDAGDGKESPGLEQLRDEARVAKLLRRGSSEDVVDVASE